MLCHHSSQGGALTPWHPIPSCPDGETGSERKGTTGDLIAQPVRLYTEDGSTFPFNSVSEVKSYILNDLQLPLRSG